MVGRRLSWSPRARADIREIVAFYKKRNGSNAYGVRLKRMMLDSVRSYHANPELGQRHGTSGLRFLLCDHYRIFYRFDETMFEVVHVWDGRWNPKDLKQQKLLTPIWS